MDAERDSFVRELFGRAAELPGEQREGFVAGACGQDLDLKAEIEELLAADGAAAEEAFWQRSAAHNESLAEQDSHSPLGTMAGHYRLVELLGKGGMGAVYRAERTDAEFEKCVAVKLIDGAFVTQDLIAHFRAERQILAHLEHPNIARLLDGGARSDGSPYFVMEYVEGISPYEYCRLQNLTISERLTLFREICSAVHYAHQHMVIHRDLKPGNILVTSDGTPKLLDFGIAKVLSPASAPLKEALTQPGMTRVTARYSSPEQIRGEPVSTATDVYSLGVILYELLTGHSPYGDADRPPHEWMTAVCDREPPRPSVWSAKLKGDLDKIVLRALRKAPAERYASVAQFSEDIHRNLQGLPVLARGDAPLYLAEKFIRRHRAFVLAASLLLCSLVGGLIEVSIARAGAERRFKEVQQLAHSVIFDYSDAMDSLPGATPVRARLVKDAVTYLDRLASDADTPDLQREIVDAYVRMSNVQGNEYENNLGDTAGSVVSARKAVAVAERLLKHDRKPPALNSAADAFMTYGDVLFSTGDLNATDTAYQRALALRTEIGGKEPQDLANNLAFSTLYRRQADLYGGFGWPNLGRTADALTAEEQAKSVIDKLSAIAPGNSDVEIERYETLISLSTAEAVVGERQVAASHLEQAIAMIESAIAAHPNDANARVELAIAEMRFGQLPFDIDNALPHIQQAVALLEHLRDADPHNAVYRRRQAVAEAELGAVLRADNQTAKGLAHERRALSLAQALNKDAPQDAQYRTDVGNIERELSVSLLAASDGSGASHHAGLAAQLLCDDQPAQADSYTLDNCSRSLIALGNAQGAVHSDKDALASFRRGVQIALSLFQADSANAVFRSDLAGAQAALAASLMKVGDASDANIEYQHALANWSTLRVAGSLSHQDGLLAEIAAKAIAAQKYPH